MIKMKTQLEELWSKIVHSDAYLVSENIIFWYLGDLKLNELFLDDVIEKIDGGFTINSEKNKDFEPIWIPNHKVYVVTYGNEVLMDRRNDTNRAMNIGADFTIPDNIMAEFTME